MKVEGKEAYVRKLSFRSASSDRLLIWFLVDSSNSRSTFSLRQVPPDSTSNPFPSSPLRRSSYMSQRSPGSPDHVNLKFLSPTWITWWKEKERRPHWSSISIWRLDKTTWQNVSPIKKYIADYINMSKQSEKIICESNDISCNKFLDSRMTCQSEKDQWEHTEIALISCWRIVYLASRLTILLSSHLREKAPERIRSHCEFLKEWFAW